ncbi:MAG: aminotransferase class I/II-fold pyridoxal phosphate-dependent enzyme [Planctomycetota bacterium]
MTALAQQHGALNLSQGFPDFEGPPDIIEAAIAAMRAGENQYARSMGHPALVNAIAERERTLYGLEYDPWKEVVVFSGATEGIASSMLGLLDPGDEVILFEPFYDSYPACCAMNGAIARYCALRFPDFSFNESELASLFNERTRLLLLNSPHNPTGKVFSRDELDLIAELCRRYEVIVLTDEVYEHLTYDGVEHVPIATLQGMRERTLRLSSTGKTYSLTGWKVGWATGPEPLVRAAQAAHQFVTYATATPLQCAMAEAIRRHQRDYFASLRADYTKRRNLLLAGLRAAGFEVTVPKGAYFVLAAFAHLWEGDDRSFARYLVEKHKIAAIPPSVFYKEHTEEGKRLLRFAFCKKLQTLAEARERLEGIHR